MKYAYIPIVAILMYLGLAYLVGIMLYLIAKTKFLTPKKAILILRYFFNQ